MGNPGINYEQVREAADRIHKSGEIPTIEKVRVELGNTGSNSTLSRHLRQWKQERTQIPPLPDNGLSSSVKTTLETLINQTRAEVRAEMQSETATLQQELDEALQKIEQLIREKQEIHLQLRDHQYQLQEARQIRALTEALQNSQKKSLEPLVTQNKCLQHQLLEQQEANHLLTQRLETATSSWEQKHNLEVQRHETLEDQYFCHLDQLRTEQQQALKLLKKGVNAQEQQSALYKEDKDRLACALTATKEQNQCLEQHCSELKTQQKQVEREYGELWLKYEQATKSYDAACFLLWYNTLYQAG
ncbi:DNA-binding protein [Endozoicomonas euniceicola]|uniref:DNA-binding protein n=1 Tax=Endozoicomonas euniceicola TaxID=1234143 RepID=A0ABY6GU93_9GAMM|nr:DNA-binding protein [Endozoicomonas euniceicola]UYM16357.1 DNA-binding protein [Endozoicomonas euniceicola]